MEPTGRWLAFLGILLWIGTPLIDGKEDIEIIELAPDDDSIEGVTGDDEGAQAPPLDKWIPENHANSDVIYGISLMKSINQWMTTPNSQNMLRTTPQLGVMGVQIGLGKVAGVVGGVIDFLFPGPSNADIIAEIQRTFNILHNKMAIISSDIKRLEREIKWGNTRLSYAYVVDVVRTAVELNMRIRTSRSAAEKRRRQERFTEHCRNQGLLNAVNTLYNGIIGRGQFRDNILDSYYTKSRGHRPNIIKLAGRLVQLATGGLLTLMSYEGIVRGIGGAEDIARDYQPRMAATKIAVENAFNKCNTHIHRNMGADLNEWLTRHSRGRNYRDTARGLIDGLKNKYNWKWISTMVYKNVRQRGYNSDARGGPELQRWNYQKKHVRLFYMDRRNYPGRANLPRARPIVERARSNSAKTAISQLQRDLKRARIPFQYLFAMKRGIGGTIIYYPHISVFSRSGGNLRFVTLR